MLPFWKAVSIETALIWGTLNLDEYKNVKTNCSSNNLLCY